MILLIKKNNERWGSLENLLKMRDTVESLNIDDYKDSNSNSNNSSQVKQSTGGKHGKQMQMQEQ